VFHLHTLAATEPARDLPWQALRVQPIRQTPRLKEYRYALNRKATNQPDLAALMRARLIGQSAAVDAIVPYVRMFQAGLAPEGRPAGVFLLLGPSGTGKTRTVEVLAEILHGSERNILKIDCGEFQMEHEVAKLIGAPPGYLGHRETQPVLSQAKVNGAASDRLPLSLVLFDEIETAAPSMQRLLLGVLDKGLLRLGDNTSVNFDRSMIFMTSNLGAQSLLRELRPNWGFGAADAEGAGEVDSSRLHAIALAAARRKFAPEFINRIDASVTYTPLNSAAIDRILDLQLQGLQRHINNRLGLRSFFVDVRPRARQFLIERGVSLEYGARELKRVIHRHLLQPMAGLLVDGGIRPVSTLTVTVARGGDRLAFTNRKPPVIRMPPRAA
jgi:ATP-dependent Clp protease ATP-binding subunit ClpA